MGRGYIKKEEKGLYEGLVARLEMGGERREREVNTISLVGVMHDNGIVVFLEYL